jgi:two-component system, OmpR family, alkaline phosphatase synthesis response regulator PhoP
MAKKILVADDEPEIVQALQIRLKEAGYEVVVAFDVIQAIYQAHKEKPDLIILDIRMPAGDGIGVYEKLKISSETAVIPVIFITAYANDEIVKKVLEMGAEGFFAKPFNIDKLLIKVKTLLGEGDRKGT